MGEIDKKYVVGPVDKRVVFDVGGNVGLCSGVDGVVDEVVTGACGSNREDVFPLTIPFSDR